jgi:hypothetical protein
VGAWLWTLRRSPRRPTDIVGVVESAVVIIYNQIHVDGAEHRHFK